jgi:hypothetical protein
MANATDAGACGVLIRASDYDQSCASLFDCVGVGEGNACDPCAIGCPRAAISRRGLSRYKSDVASATTGVDAGGAAFCSCPLWSGAWCVGGRCVPGG